MSKTLTCPVCKKEFETKHLNQKYCSVKCRDIKNGRRRPESLDKKTCPICGKEFIPKSGNQKYCSKDCYNQEQKNKRKPIDLIVNVCPVCGKKFETKKINKKFCSDECRAMANSKSVETLYELYLDTKPSRPDSFETFKEKQRALRYRKKHGITLDYCERHNICHKCPYPFNVCLFE